MYEGDWKKAWVWQPLALYAKMESFLTVNKLEGVVLERLKDHKKVVYMIRKKDKVTIIGNLTEKMMANE